MRIFLLFIIFILVSNSSYAFHGSAQAGMDKSPPALRLNTEDAELAEDLRLPPPKEEIAAEWSIKLRELDTLWTLPSRILRFVTSESSENKEDVPEIEMAVELLTDTLYIGQSSKERFIISNTGEGELNVSLSVEEEDKSENISWFSLSVLNASIGPGEQQPVDVTFDASDLTADSYSVYITIESNDSENEEIKIPANLRVVEPEDGKLQIVHNSADPGMEELVLYINDEEIDNEFTYRSATGMIDLPPFEDTEVSLVKSGENGDVVLDTVITVGPGEYNQLVVSGLHDPGEFSGNPYINTRLEFMLISDIAAEAGSARDVHLQWMHGVTDANALFVEMAQESTQGFEVYHQVGVPLEVAALNYDVNISNPVSQEVLNEMQLDLSEIGGQAITVFLTGFLDPDGNQNGDRISFFALNRDGEKVVGKAAKRAAKEGPESLSDRVELFSNYPNPFNPITAIEFSVPESQHVKLEIFDVTGRHVTTLVDRQISSGTHSCTWNASNAASGIYLSRLQAGNIVRVQQMHLIK